MCVLRLLRRTFVSLYSSSMVCGLLATSSAAASVPNHTSIGASGWDLLMEDNSFPDTGPLSPNASPGGILLYSLGRVGSESLYHAIKSVSSGAITAAYDRYGGETFKDTHPQGIPVAGLNLSIRDGYRYTHVKPMFIRFGQGNPARVQTTAELMRIARVAGFTMVMAVDRTNELSQYLSEIEFGCQKGVDCAQRYERFCQQRGNLVEELELRRREIRLGLATALSEGLSVFLSTFEDVVTDSCALAQGVLRAYNLLATRNKNQARVRINTRVCPSKAVVSSATNFSALTLEERLGSGPHACLIQAIGDHPEYSWMMDEGGKRMRPPTTWRTAFDGLLSSRSSGAVRVFSSSTVAAQAAETQRLYPHCLMCH